MTASTKTTAATAPEAEEAAAPYAWVCLDCFEIGTAASASDATKAAVAHSAESRTGHRPGFSSYGVTDGMTARDHALHIAERAARAGVDGAGPLTRVITADGRRL